MTELKKAIETGDVTGLKEVINDLRISVSGKTTTGVLPHERTHQ